MAYSVSNGYKQVIYSQDDDNDIKIWFNGVELEEAGYYIEKVSCKSRIFPDDGTKRLSLDNFISKEIEIVIHNIDLNIIQDQVEISIGTMVDNSYEYVPLGIFNIQDIPTTNNNATTIKLRDNRVKFDFNYNAKPLMDLHGGKATYKQILDDICSQAGVISDVESFDGDDTLTALYDNTITSTVHVSYLAEQCGMTPVITREGHLKFVDFANLTTWRIPLSILSNNYIVSEPFSIERVVFEMGTIKYQTSSDESLNTLFINSANLYLTSQSQVDNIFSKLEDFTIDSVELTQSILGNPAIDPWDLIEVYDDYNNGETIFKTFANCDYIFNGKHKQLFKTLIGTEERNENVSKNSDATFKYRINSEINAIDGRISQTVERVDEHDNEISEISQSIDEIESKIENISDLTVEDESNYAEISLLKVGESQPVMIKIRPLIDSIYCLYPRNDLYPSDTLLLRGRKIKFQNLSTGEITSYELPDDLLYYNENNYDEFYLEYSSQTCKVIKKCKFDDNGDIALLEDERTDYYVYPTISLKKGNYKVYIDGYENGYIYAELILDGKMSDLYYTKSETDSHIKQTADSIELGVSKKLENYSTTEEMNSAISITAEEINSEVRKKVGDDEIISKINQSAEQIQINADKIDINGKAVHFKTNINETKGQYTQADATRALDIFRGTIIPTQQDYEKYDINGNNIIDLSDVYQINNAIQNNNGYINLSGTYEINPYSSTKSVAIYDNDRSIYQAILSLKSSTFEQLYSSNIYLKAPNQDYNGSLANNGFGFNDKYGSISSHIAENVVGETIDTEIELFNYITFKTTKLGANGIVTPTVTQTSLAENKKNFEKLNNALDIIKDIDIYKYNFKNDKKTDKKHIGLVIGNKYKYSKEVTSENNDGVDIYSFISVCCQAIKEQQEQIEELKQEIKSLKGDDN